MAWALMFVVCTRVVSAQSAAPAPESSVKFMPNTDFHVSAEHLSGADEGYWWDANFGGEFDIIDYGTGRATFVANYQVILGTEFRNYDPNQGNYILAGSSSYRYGDYEIAGVFHHESRHLADRPNRVAVAWNMLGGRVRRVFVSGPARVDARIDLRKTIARAFVDYTWEFDAGVRSDVQVAPHVGAFAFGDLRRLGVDGNQNRGGQTGYRIEGGVHVSGVAGGIEFFLANERRVDPYPLEFGTVNWVTVGFRLLSR
jgi:hypothetical protein